MAAEKSPALSKLAAGGPMGAAEVSSYRDVPRQSFDLVDSRAPDRPFSSRFPGSPLPDAVARVTRPPGARWRSGRRDRRRPSATGWVTGAPVADTGRPPLVAFLAAVLVPSAHPVDECRLGVPVPLLEHVAGTRGAGSATLVGQDRDLVDEMGVLGPAAGDDRRAGPRARGRRRGSPITQRPRLAQREPRSLLPEQMGQLAVYTPAAPQRGARLGAAGGRCRGTGPAQRDCLDRRAVRVRYGSAPHQHAVWVWAGAVERA
jgi:hypothetical protein